VKKIVNRLRFDRIMAVSLWPHFFGPPCRGYRVPASARGNGRNVASAGWEVTPCDPIWHASSRSGETSCMLLYRYILYFTYIFTIIRHREVRPTCLHRHAATSCASCRKRICRSCSTFAMMKIDTLEHGR